MNINEMSKFKNIFESKIEKIDEAKSTLTKDNLIKDIFAELSDLANRKDGNSPPKVTERDAKFANKQVELIKDELKSGDATLIRVKNLINKFIPPGKTAGLDLINYWMNYNIPIIFRRYKNVSPGLPSKAQNLLNLRTRYARYAKQLGYIADKLIDYSGDSTEPIPSVAAAIDKLQLTDKIDPELLNILKDLKII